MLVVDAECYREIAARLGVELITTGEFRGRCSNIL
jgi:hypothetical protein